MLDDAVADLISGGFAYGEFALANRQLYRLLMGVTEVPHLAVSPGALTTLAEGVDALSVLVDAVQRVIDAKRIRAQDATVAATQILSATHGYVLLAIAGLVEVQGIKEVMLPRTVNVIVGLGDKRQRRVCAWAVECADSSALSGVSRMKRHSRRRGGEGHANALPLSGRSGRRSASRR